MFSLTDSLLLNIKPASVFHGLRGSVVYISELFLCQVATLTQLTLYKPDTSTLHS